MICLHRAYMCGGNRKGGGPAGPLRPAPSSFLQQGCLARFAAVYTLVLAHGRFRGDKPWLRAKCVECKTRDQRHHRRFTSRTPPFAI